MPATQLTDREQQIRALVADGLTNEDIAARLKISSRTVESHLRMLFRKLNVTRRDQLTPSALTSSPDEVPSAESKLRELEEQLRSYETAIRRMTDRQTPLFTERVQITATIGESPADDVIEERRWTTPKPYLVYRVTRPVLPEPPAGPVDVDELGVSCEVVEQDVGVAVQIIVDRNSRYQLLVTFQPGLNRETEWVLRYRVPGLWDPLREHGNDVMTWRPGTFEQAPSATSVSELSVRFVFPPDATSVDVTERRGFGVTEDEHPPEGRQVLLWKDLQPGGSVYRWALKMSR
jgi:DNA-binding CsgD family transcriptional regulator